MKSTKTIITLAVIVAFVLILCGNACSTYNGLVKEDVSAENAWANVQNQYQRRFDLIPNLVETVKGYAAHESQTFEKVTEARAGLSNAYNDAKALEGTGTADTNFENYAKAQDGLNRAISVYVNAVHEAYPDLKANTQFLDLQTQLEGTENRIATERTRYNDAVKEFNVHVRRFPANIWAGMFGFTPKQMFQAETEAQSAPKVSF